jgi:S-adenosylmethionine-diacylglycerol 3-amino-3-carboxypropyl transferase
MDFDIIRYSQVWEDHEMLTEALQINAEDDVLSIGSAGCNVLAILLKEPRSIVALDLSNAQIALVELKLVAIEHISHTEFLTLLGVRPNANKALQIYDSISTNLSPVSKAFWDQNKSAFAEGIIHSGKLERFFKRFSAEHLSKLWKKSDLDAFLSSSSLDEQNKHFANLFTPAFQQSFRTYFSQTSIEQGGRDPAQFAHVKSSNVEDALLARFVKACTILPICNNFYMEYFLTGTYEHSLPPYLQVDNFAKLKKLVKRVSLVCQDIESLVDNMADGTFSKANLSNIFEYMSQDLADRLFELFAEKMRDGARIAFWNLFVERGVSKETHGLTRLEADSKRLASRDRAWFYQAFHVVAKHQGGKLG